MTTATKTRPRRTKKKAVAKKKATTKKKSSRRGSAKAKTKKPKWTLITFKQIEGWRTKLGLSKSGMAEALQVTNSTYHNWRRGTTVPHPNQQQDILHRLNALETNAAATGKSSGASGKSGGKAPRSKRAGGKTGAARNRLRLGDGGSDGGNGVGGLPGDNGSRQAHLDVVSPGTHPTTHKVPRDDIAAITVAYIQSQKKEVSAGSIVSFVRDLREVL